MAELPEILVGAPREQALVEFGFSPALLALLADPEADPCAAIVAASDGTVLAEIAELPGVAGSLPSGTIAPVCHVDDSQLVYDLLVREGEDAVWTLVRWSPEGCEPVLGGVLGYLTDRVVEVWEACEVEDPRLLAWAEAIGHPAAARLLAELGVVGRGTLAEHHRWRAEFLASLGAEPG